MRKFTIFLACLLFMGLQVVQAQRTITGKITSKEDGKTIPGVTITVYGTTIGTATDEDGYYEITVPKTATKLVYTFVGMKQAEAAIGASTVMNLEMEPDVLQIEGVVVTAIGIKRETKALGYSVQEVGGDNLTTTQNANVINQISGKVAGVQVQQSSGAAGGASYITIRGPASILQSNQPLFVIDGVPVDNDFAYSGNPDDGRNNLNEGVAYSNRVIDLNSDDIASVSVLKGGAATALYGLRAANGAIVITTKKGQVTKGKRVAVTVSSSVSLDRVNKLPEFQERFVQGNNGLWKGPETHEGTSWGPNADTLYWNGATDYAWDNNGKIVGASDPTAVKKFDPYLDQYDDFFQTGVTFNNNVAISGGSEKGTFYLSIGNLNSKGVVPNNTFDKTSVRLSGEAQVWDKLKSSASITYSKSGGVRIQQGSNLSGVGLTLWRTPISFDNTNGSDDPVNDTTAYMFADGTQRCYRDGIFDNPYWGINKTQFKDNVDRIIGNFALIYTPKDWITVTYRIGNDFYIDRRDYYFDIGTNNYVNGQVSEDHHYNQDINSDLIVSFQRDINTNIKTNTTIGQNMYTTTYQQSYSQGDGLTIPGFYSVSNATNVLSREVNLKKRTAAIYADVGFSYKDMLFLNVTGRNEWSTSLPKDDNSFFYPSFSGAFIFTELPFLKDNKILPFGKLRASYAIIANDAPIYGTKSYYNQSAFGDGWTTGIAFPFRGSPGFVLSNILGNDKIKPEKLKSFEMGADLRFLKNRLGVDVSYYENTNEDLLLNVEIASTTGYVATLLNAATMKNTGIEVLFRATPLKSKNFQWDVIVNFTRNRNEVVDLAEGLENVTLGGFTGSLIVAQVGEPYGSIYGEQWVKDDAGNIIVNDDPNDSKYGYPMLASEEGVIGNIQPDFITAITNEFRYKNWSFSFMIDIKEGGQMWNGTKGALTHYGRHISTDIRETSTVFNGLTGHLDANGNLVHFDAGGNEVAGAGGENTASAMLDQDWFKGVGGGFNGPTEQFVEETSWVRLREVYISYNFTKMLEKSFVKSLEVYFSGRNLWLNTTYTGIDPETSLYGAHNAQGMDYFQMPNTKTYTFGLKAGF